TLDLCLEGSLEWWRCSSRSRIPDTADTSAVTRAVARRLERSDNHERTLQTSADPHNCADVARRNPVLSFAQHATARHGVHSESGSMSRCSKNRFGIANNGFHPPPGNPHDTSPPFRFASGCQHRPDRSWISRSRPAIDAYGAASP